MVVHMSNELPMASRSFFKKLQVKATTRSWEYGGAHGPNARLPGGHCQDNQLPDLIDDSWDTAPKATIVPCTLHVVVCASLCHCPASICFNKALLKAFDSVLIHADMLASTQS